jgi:MFS family permease
MRGRKRFGPITGGGPVVETAQGFLDRWAAAGLVSSEQVDRILAHERVRPDQDGRHGARNWQAEVVGYVGAAFALGAAALLLAEFYADLLPTARVTIAGLVMVAALASGAALVASDAPALRRLTGVLWTGALASTAWTASIVAGDLIDVDSSWLPAAIGAPTLILGLILLGVGRHELVQLATLAALVTTSAGVLGAAAVLPPEQLAYGTLLLGTGLAWGLAGAGGWLGPRWTAEVTGGILALIGTQVLATGERRVLGLVLGLVLAAAAVTVSVPTGRPRLLLLGAAALFILVPQLVFELFADTLGAPATLLAIGLLLILLAVGLGRVRRGAVDDAATHHDVVDEEVHHG